jgi:AcrR family transcriptional regulator
MSDSAPQSTVAEDRPRRTNVRGIKSRRRLLEAAAWCFSVYGYGGTRVSDIVGRAGMSQGAFYRHFTDKDEALLEALGEPLEELLETTGWTADGHSAALEALVRRNTSFFGVYARHAGLFRVMREAAAAPGSSFRGPWLGVRGRYVARIEEWLSELRDDGVIDGADLPLLAATLGAMLDQLAYTRIGMAEVPPRPEELAAMGRVTAEVWHAALAARTPRTASVHARKRAVDQ